MNRSKVPRKDMSYCQTMHVSSIRISTRIDEIVRRPNLASNIMKILSYPNSKVSSRSHGILIANFYNKFLPTTHGGFIS